MAVVVLRGSRTMRNCVTNLFLVNLAFADLLVVLACLPFTLVAHLIYREFLLFLDTAIVQRHISIRLSGCKTNDIFKSNKKPSK